MTAASRNRENNNVMVAHSDTSQGFIYCRIRILMAFFSLLNLDP
jgi:hypothetical protein